MNELKPLFVKIYNVWNEKKPGYYAKSMSILYEITEKIKNVAGIKVIGKAGLDTFAGDVTVISNTIIEI